MTGQTKVLEGHERTSPSFSKSASHNLSMNGPEETEYAPDINNSNRTPHTELTAKLQPAQD